MGNDGGSIPTRRELVKSASRAPTLSELKATLSESLTHAWSFDPLTNLPLDLDNVVSDYRGRLYNYESILRALLPGAGEESPESASSEGGLKFSSTGIKSLRDIVKLKLKTAGKEKGKRIYACPVSLKELGPGTGTKSVYLVPCGHVFAEVAVKEVDERVCPECSEGFERRDVIPVLPTEEKEVERLEGRLEELRRLGLTHGLKKEKKEKGKKRKAGEGEGGEGKEERKRETKSGDKVKGINNPMTATVTARVMAEQEENNKRRRLAAQG